MQDRLLSEERSSGTPGLRFSVLTFNQSYSSSWMKSHQRYRFSRMSSVSCAPTSTGSIRNKLSR